MRPRQRQAGITFSYVQSTVCAVVLFGLCVLCAGTITDWFSPIQTRSVLDPAGHFKQITNLKWPASAKLISAESSHWEPILAPVGPGMLEIKKVIVFEADRDSLSKWAAGAAPWGTEWQRGPVPQQLLHSAGMPFRDSDSIMFAVSGHRSNIEPDDLLVLDLSSGRVWLASWD